MIAEGWNEVKRKPTAASVSEAPAEKDVLVGKGWTVAAKASVKDLQVGVPGVCLATQAEAKQACLLYTSDAADE